MSRQKPTRRAVLRGAMATGVVAALSACGATPAPSAERAATEATASAPAEGAPAAAEEQFSIEILVDFSDEYMQYANDVVHVAAKEKYPGITINIVPMDWGTLEEKLLTSKAAGAMPDIFRESSDTVPVLVVNDLARPLDDYLDDWGTRDDFFPSALSDTSWLGKVWALPQLTSPRHYCYRKDIADEAGVEISDDWTFDDFLDAASALTLLEGGKVIRMGASSQNSTEEFFLVVEAAGQAMIQNCMPAFINEKGFWALDWIGKRNNAAAPQAASPLPDSPIPYIATGQVVIQYGHPGYWYTVMQQNAPDKAEYLVVPNPPLKEKRVATTNTDFLAVSTTTKYPDAVWEVLKSHMEPEALATFNQQWGYVPPRISAAEQAEYMQSPVMQAVSEHLAEYGTAWPRLPGWAPFNGLVQPAIEAVTLGMQTAEQALTDIEAELNELFTTFDWPEGACS
ncbi:MAG: extracellular solute-binding protein [Anaerolineae bacterium]|nr:extracellular solute-binding protein [Anaerolineae bacterium]